VIASVAWATALWPGDTTSSVVTGNPTASPTPGVSTPLPSATPTPSPTPDVPHPKIHRCQDVELPPPDTETNTSVDREHGILSFSWYDPKLGRDRVYYVDYRNDPTCNDNRALARLIRDAVNP